MKKLIVNPQNPNGVLVDMTADEIALRQSDLAINLSSKAELATAKAQKKADALAGNNKLLELGLTQAEATALTGYTPPTEV